MEYNPYAFITDDIIAWNGIVCKYGSVSHLISDGDDLRIANELENDDYKRKNK
jgi:hypothetical protein